MRRWIGFGALGLVGLALGGLWSASSPAPNIRLIMPDGFRGPFTVLFDEPKGEKPVWEGRTLVLRVPPSGVLRVDLDGAKIPTGMSPGGETYSGQKLGETFFNVAEGFGPGIPADAVVAQFETVIDNRKYYGFMGAEKDFKKHVRDQSRR